MGRGRNIAATLLMALGLFGLLSLFFDATGQMGSFLSEQLRRLAGWAAFAPTLIITWLGMRLFRQWWDTSVARRLVGFILLLAVTVLCLHLYYRLSTDWPTTWTPAEELLIAGSAGGGMLGGLLAGLLMKLLGPLGTGLASTAMVIVAWILLVDNTVRQLARRVLSRMASIGNNMRALAERFSPRLRRKVDGVHAASEEAAAAEELTVPKVAPPPVADDESARREASGGRSRRPHRSGGAVFALPSTSLLERPKPVRKPRQTDEEDQARQLEETLASFGVDGRVVSSSRGPTVTRYEVQPPPGVKVSRIVGLADDISLNLAASGVRVEAPVPGKSVVGIEVPNKETSPVFLREILESPEFQQAKSPLTIGLGRDIAGKPLVADLAKLLHLLIAGATGSGKSVCLNSIITSLLYKARPDEVKMMMIDPKRVELSVYDGIPHLIAPVVTDPRQAAGALRWAVKEMERRYELLSAAGVRNVDGYNRSRRKPTDGDEFIPYLVVIIDELADLMLVAAADVEDSICRLAQMARAAGIYLIIATQRPSVDVITGLIKANVPSRLAFAVSSQVDSRTILDMGGAERLLGKGDMLFYPLGAPKPIRAQGAWVSDAEVEEVANAWRVQAEPEYIEEVLATPSAEPTEEADAEDELFDDAVQLVREMGHASVSMLQRRFRIGYARAARLIDVMELRGIVGPYQGSKPREVIGADDAARQR